MLLENNLFNPITKIGTFSIHYIHRNDETNKKANNNKIILLKNTLSYN